MFKVDTDNILLKRFTIAKKLDYYIEESIYYRTHSESMNINSRKVLWRIQDLEGKTEIK
jgi:hypothetical protein